jgi:hypothetical protein
MAVGELLARLGLTSQKPLQRAYQCDPEAIEKWRRERFPAIARQAEASGGEVYFWDESGFRADAVNGRTWGKTGQASKRRRRRCHHRRGSTFAGQTQLQVHCPMQPSAADHRSPGG